MNTKKLLGIILVVTFMLSPTQWVGQTHCVGGESSAVCADAVPVGESTLATLVDTDKVIHGLDLGLYPAFEHAIMTEDEMDISLSQHEEDPWPWINTHISEDLDLKSVPKFELMMYSVIVLLDSLGEYTKFINFIYIAPKLTDPGKVVLEVYFPDNNRPMIFAEWKRGTSAQVTSVAVPREFLLQLGYALRLWNPWSIKDAPMQELYKKIEYEIEKKGGIKEAADQLKGWDYFNEPFDPVLKGKQVLEDAMRVHTMEEYALDDNFERRTAISEKIQELRAYIREIDHSVLSYKDLENFYNYTLNMKIAPLIMSGGIIPAEQKFFSWIELMEDHRSSYSELSSALHTPKKQRLFDDIVAAIYDDIEHSVTENSKHRGRVYTEKNMLALTWLREFRTIFLERVLMQKLVHGNGDRVFAHGPFSIEVEHLVAEIDKSVYQVVLEEKNSNRKMYLFITFTDDRCTLSVLDQDHVRVMYREITYEQQSVFFYESAMEAFKHDIVALSHAIFDTGTPEGEDDVGLVLDPSGPIRGKIDATYLLKYHTLVMYSEGPEVTFDTQGDEAFMILNMSNKTFFYLGTAEKIELPAVNEECAAAPDRFAIHLKQLDPEKLPAVELVYEIEANSKDTDANKTEEERYKVIWGNLEWDGDQLAVRHLGLKVRPRIPGLIEIRIMDRIDEEGPNMDARVLRSA